MSRSPLAYPLLRPLDGDAGGAADLQTDIMRFMAILALCLMAIFALVQSVPQVASIPAEPPPPEPIASEASPADEPPPPMATTEPPRALALTRPEPRPVPVEAAKPVALARPQAQAASPPPAAASRPSVDSPPDAPPESAEGFTLRFESDIALARLVATGQVGFFAMDDDGAQRMSVSGNTISFWSAPVPNRYHEMDGNTVPKAVRDALARTGRGAEVSHWAVTLPTRLTGELQALMQEHSGGALVIARDGSLRREST
ncbi:MAG: hypothetical protein V2I25_07535 [Woeseiaceae bacterium]|jgi:hypothetical protein|nr:hypothetical protein [Woeseiaceae bacterium]